MPPVEEGRFSTEGSVHLDALRGAAALVVVLGHTRSLYFSSVAAPQGQSAGSVLPQSVTRFDPAQPPVREKITIGNEAVMIFFVLSGFLVGGSVLKAFRRNSWSWKDYMGKRLTRLWVVLIPALLLGCLIDHAGMRLFAGAQSIYDAPAQQLIVVGDPAERLGLGVFLGNTFFTQGILVQDFGVNESLWSLAYEFWYYLLFPLLGVALLTKSRLLPRLLALIGFLGISYFVGPEVLKLFPVWIMGAGVAALPLSLSGPAAKRLAMVAGGVLIVALPLLRRAPASIYLAEWGIAVLSAWLIYLIKHLDLKRRPDWYSAISGFFSRISYTLYLVHLPLAVFVCALLNRPWHIWAKTGPNLSIWFAMNLGLIGAAYVFYLLFEANTDAIRRMILGRTERRIAG